MTDETRLQADIEALRPRFPDTQDLYREVCAILFFRYGITPTANKLYQLVRMYRLQFSTTPNRPHQAFAEHHRILDAIEARDGELAELLMRRHIGTSKRNIERHYVSQCGQEALTPSSKTRGDS